MNYRVLIFDDDSIIRQVLWTFFDNRGYEVFTFPNPALCPLSEKDICPCPEEQPCADIILSDMQMPLMKGLDFIDAQIEKGCKCSHLALMSGNFTEAHIAKARSLGITLFTKPFRLSELKEWLDNVEKHIDPTRKLADWYLKGVTNRKDTP